MALCFWKVSICATHVSLCLHVYLILFLCLFFFCLFVSSYFSLYILYLIIIIYMPVWFFNEKHKGYELCYEEGGDSWRCWGRENNDQIHCMKNFIRKKYKWIKLWSKPKLRSIFRIHRNLIILQEISFMWNLFSMFCISSYEREIYGMNRQEPVIFCYYYPERNLEKQYF